jgi:hypothetical protein
LCIADLAPNEPDTDPTNEDTDGDLVIDGAEDGNQNGRYDAGDNELDPNDDTDVTPTEQNACAVASLREIVLVQRPDQSADLILAVPVDFPTNRITTLSNGVGEIIGAMVFDPADQVAGVAMKVNVAGADATAKLNTIQATLDGALGNVNAFASQAFASWDTPGGNNAALGRVAWTHDANGTAAQSLNAIVAALVPGAGGVLNANGSTALGPYSLEVEVLVRSPNTTLVVVSLANQASVTATARIGFKLDDLGNGTAVAQFGDDTGVQCDRFLVEPLQKVDFLLLIDNSGSMDNEQTATANAAAQIGAQLAASTVDFRVAVVTSDVDGLQNNVAEWTSCTSPAAGTCAQANPLMSNDQVYCPFTNNTAVLQACVDGLNVSGNGEENFFRPVACLMGKTVVGPGINLLLTGVGELGGDPDGEACGRDLDNSRAPFQAGATYPIAPAGFAMLPRAEGNPSRLRPGAQLAVIFITDANEQSDGRYVQGTVTEAVAVHSIPSWVTYFQDFDGAGDPLLSRAIVHGLTCPAGTNCTDENGNYMNTRFQQFLSALGGVEAALPDNADPQNAQKIADAIGLIMQQSIAQSSPYVLVKPPISSTIKLAVDFLTVGACNTADMPRSRQDGFDYDGTTNSVTFFGSCRPLLDNSQVGRPFAISYRYWIEDSPNPDGNNDPCGDCQAPFVCVAGQCLCPFDCGLPDGVGPGQTCDATTCTAECLPDCGGCPDGAACQQASVDCACACPADCNTGAALPANQVCDPLTCLPTCAPDGCDVADRPGANYVCGASCLWECPADCGEPDISPTERCDRFACAVECSPDCNATCDGFSVCNSDPSVCACECVDTATCSPGFAFDNDPAVCGCTCTNDALGCPATHTPNLEDCRCECAANCGDVCDASTVCNEATCTCVPFGG